jgi:hypothetical protein
LAGHFNHSDAILGGTGVPGPRNAEPGMFEVNLPVNRFG